MIDDWTKHVYNLDNLYFLCVVFTGMHSINVVLLFLVLMHCKYSFIDCLVYNIANLLRPGSTSKT